MFTCSALIKITPHSSEFHAWHSHESRVILRSYEPKSVSVTSTLLCSYLDWNIWAWVLGNDSQSIKHLLSNHTYSYYEPRRIWAHILQWLLFSHSTQELLTVVCNMVQNKWSQHWLPILSQPKVTAWYERWQGLQGVYTLECSNVTSQYCSMREDGCLEKGASTNMRSFT